MSDAVNVRSIVREFLKSAGFDGLYEQDGECACLVDDLAPCEQDAMVCRPGYRVPCDCGEMHGFHVQALKPKAEK